MFPVCSFRPVVCFLLVVIKSITETNGAAPHVQPNSHCDRKVDVSDAVYLITITLDATPPRQKSLRREL